MKHLIPLALACSAAAGQPVSWTCVPKVKFVPSGQTVEWRAYVERNGTGIGLASASYDLLNGVNAQFGTITDTWREPLLNSAVEPPPVIDGFNNILGEDVAQFPPIIAGPDFLFDDKIRIFTFDWESNPGFIGQVRYTPNPGPTIVYLDSIGTQATYSSVATSSCVHIIPGGFTWFQGLPHVPQGSATLTPLGGRLVLSNIGASGDDGVEIEPGDSEGYGLTLGLPGGPSSGARVLFRPSGDVNGPQTQVLYNLAMTSDAGGYRLRLEPGALAFSGVVLDVLVGQTVVASYAPSGPIFGPTLATFAPIPAAAPEVHPWFETDQTTIGLGGFVPIVLGDGTTATGDALRIRPVSSDKVGSLTRAGILASDIGTLELFNTRIRKLGADMSAIGGVELKAGHDHLIVSNIGASGDDGVYMVPELPPIAGVLATLEPVGIGPGQDIVVGARGTFSGAPDSDLGWARLRRVGGQVRVRADFSPIGASLVRVEMYDDGSFVGASTLPGSGVLGTLAGPSGDTNVHGCGKLPPDPPCIIMDVDDDSEFNGSDGTMLVGNQLRILAADAGGTIDQLEVLTIRGRNLGEIDILGLTALEPDCPADWNGDGFVNTADFIAYLNDYNVVLSGGAWVFNDPDIAPPVGALNTADFIAYLNAFSAGCP